MTFIDKLKSYKGKDIIHISPPFVLGMLYIVCMFAGAILLSLPFASSKSTTFFDNLFTAVSSLTLTGLTVVDTGSDYTIFGQFVIAILIQLGGLGLMAFSVLVLSMLGMRIPVSKQILLCEDLSQTDIGSLMKLVSFIFKIVFMLELIGVIALAFRFVPDLGWKLGIWNSVFYSISAFNNAGFSLSPDSLTKYVGDYNINITISFLVIVGALGFSVILDVVNKRSWAKLTLHSKLTISGTFFLTLFAFIFFMFLEWNNPGTLGPLEMQTKIIASWFQAITPRSSGFNTVDIGATTDSTSLMTMILMGIGGGSTSTAGGIKVTTFMVMILSVITFFKRQEEIDVFGRSIPQKQVIKAMGLIIISLLIITTSLFVITITNDKRFIDLFFEVCSAFGTTGLSRGVTPELDAVGRLVIMTLMIIGRVGPLMVAFFLASRTTPRVKYPPDNVLLV